MLMFKKFLLISSSALLKITLFFLALAGASWMTFSSSAAPKKALEESGVYNDVVGTVLAETQKSVQKEGSDFPVSDPSIQATINKALPPEFLQQNVEGVIDGIYSWLQGSTETPEFTIDITAAKQSIIAGVADYAAARSAGLPVCTLQQLRELGTEIDPYNAPCRPPGLTAEQVRSQAAAQLASQDEFLKDTVITADTLPKDEEGKTVVQNFEAAPGIFQLTSWLPWALGLLAVLCGAAVLFLSETKKKGLNSIGITLLGVGIFLFLGSLLITYAFNQANRPGKLIQEGNAFNANIIRGLDSIMDSYNQTLRNFYVVYMLLGAMVLLVLWWQGRQTAQATVTTNSPKTKK
jgi:hypothetical protein